MSIGPLTPPQEPKPPRHSDPFPVRLRNRVLNSVEAVVIVAILSFLLGLLGEFHFVFDLASHFRVQAGVVALIGGVTLALFRDFRLGALAVAAGTALLLSTYRYYLPIEPPLAGLPIRRLLVMNVLRENQDRQTVIDFVQIADPDVILLFETDQAWQAALSTALAERWPHQKVVPLNNHYGMCLFSKQQWTSAQQLELTALQIPLFDVQFAEPDWRMISTHALAPLGGRAWRVRNEQFDAIAKLVSAGETRRTVLVGDLNCTPWAPKMRAFVKQTGLRDAAYGHQLKFTWYVAPLPLAGLPIDHVLVGAEIGVTSHQVGPPLGSDHRPVTVELAMGR
jgi:endonuclease/exonuclease/phosphatase (EEP) superfamily protein YafD